MMPGTYAVAGGVRGSRELNIDMTVPATGTIGALAIPIAFCVDQLFGEPPALLHPVVWIGDALSSTGAPWTGVASATAFARGAAIWLMGAALSAGAAWGAVASIRFAIGTSSAGAVLAQAALVGLLLKPLLAWRMLRDEVIAVERSVDGNVEAGRNQLRRLVSRDTSQLSATEVRESALESLAENLNDSLGRVRHGRQLVCDPAESKLR
jgi:adenosylcobinamide-phosphate synthase